MKAGRELDLIVAMKVMGLEKDPENPRYYRYPVRRHERDLNWFVLEHEKDDFRGMTGSLWPDLIPKYSTELKDAWEVIQKMKSMGYSYRTETHSEDVESFDVVSCEFKKDGKPIFVIAESIPEAICLAALKAVLDR